MKDFIFYFLFCLSCLGETLRAETLVSLKELQGFSSTQHSDVFRFQEQTISLQGQRRSQVYLPSPTFSYEEMSGEAMGSMRQPRWAIKQRLPFPLKIYWSRQSVQEQIEGNENEKAEMDRRRLSELNTEYQRWQAYYQKAQILKEEEKLLSQLISVQRTRYISQKVSQTELVALQIESGYLLTSISEVDAELALQKAKIESLAGVSLSELKPGRRDFVPQSHSLHLLPKRSYSQAELKEKIEQFNTELKQSRRELASAEAESRVARWSWVPDLEVMYSSGRDFRDLSYSTLEVGFEIPIWLGQETWGENTKTGAEERKAQILASEKLRQKVLEAEGLLEVQAQLRKQLDLMENGLIQLSNQNVKAARTQYQTGTMSYSNFLALIQTSYKTLMNYEDLKVKVVQNQEELKRLLGESL